MSQSKNSLPVPFKLRARKKEALEEKLAGTVRQFPVVYDKSLQILQGLQRLALEDVAKQVALQTGLHCSIACSFICLMFSLVRIMLLYGCSFLGFFCLGIN